MRKVKILVCASTALLLLTTGCASICERCLNQDRYDYWSTSDSHMAGTYDRYYLGTSWDYRILSSDCTYAGAVIFSLDLPLSAILDTALLPLDITMTMLDRTGK